MIKHLVLSGGANTGYVFFGILRELIERGFFDMDNIETIYSTSVGTIVAVYLCLQYPLEDIEVFLVDRPWQELYKVDFHIIVRAIQEGGMFSRVTLVKTLQPMLLGKDISTEVSLQEFYEITKKEIHFYTTEYTQLKLVDVSYKTHPHWKLIDAVYASSCLPLLFDPFFADNHYYIDGGILKNYPLYQCLQDGHDPDTILGIYHDSNKENKELRMATPFMNPSTSYRLIEYTLSFLMKLWTIVKHPHHEDEKKVKYQIPAICDSQPLRILELFESKEVRINLIKCGNQTAKDWLNVN